jgi:hypothetical protein
MAFPFFFFAPTSEVHASIGNGTYFGNLPFFTVAVEIPETESIFVGNAIYFDKLPFFTLSVENDTDV